MFSPGKETVVEVGGRAWTVGRLTVSATLAFRDWVAAQVGDPFEGLERLAKFLPPDELMQRVRAAEDLAEDLRRFSLGTATARKWLATEAGAAALVQLLLRPHHPQATLDDAFAVMLALGSGGLQKAIDEGQGSVPNGEGPPATGGSTGTPSSAR